MKGQRPVTPESLRARAHALLAFLPECTTPAYGAPGLAHCAACCYGTGLDPQTPDQQEMYLAACDLLTAADQLAAHDLAAVPS